MRYGLEAPGEIAVGCRDDVSTSVAQELRNMELRALRHSGRLEELRAAADVAFAEEEKKAKIIERLKDV